jgi:choloylglycine hydrolase
MCTSLTLPIPAAASAGRRLFGRTLDLDTHFGERVILTRPHTPLRFGSLPTLTSHHALLGMGAAEDGYPLYADAMNDQGLCMAGLRFAGETVYADCKEAERPSAGRMNLAPWELIPYLLGTCASVEEAKLTLESVRVVDRPFSERLPAAPLHWHVADADPTHGELVVECTAAGMAVYENPAGVLTNSPPFPEQLAGLAAFDTLTNRPTDTLGGGGVGLPGDYTSASRFVRAAILRRWAMEGASALSGNPDAVGLFFRILGAVAPPDGAVLTESGASHRTLYACCMDGAAGAYHRVTEGDFALRTVGFEDGGEI